MEGSQWAMYIVNIAKKVPVSFLSTLLKIRVTVGSPNQFLSKVAWVVRPGEQINGSPPVRYSGKQRFKLIYKTIKHLINNKTKNRDKVM